MRRVEIGPGLALLQEGGKGGREGEFEEAVESGGSSLRGIEIRPGLALLREGGREGGMEGRGGANTGGREGGRERGRDERTFLQVKETPSFPK